LNLTFAFVADLHALAQVSFMIVAVHSCCACVACCVRACSGASIQFSVRSDIISASAGGLRLPFPLSACSPAAAADALNCALAALARAAGAGVASVHALGWASVPAATSAAAAAPRATALLLLAAAALRGGAVTVRALGGSPGLWLALAALLFAPPLLLHAAAASSLAC
jgi:hypothetical protein